MKSNTTSPNYSPAKLYDCGGILSERWYVGYSYRNPNTGKLKRIKVYEDLHHYKKLDERRKAGKNLVQKINRKLLKGFNPFNNYMPISENVIHKAEEGKPSQVQQPTLTIGQQLEGVLASQSEDLRKKSFQTYASKIKIFISWLVMNGLDEIDIESFTNNHAREFLRHLTEELDNSPTTRNAYLERLRSFFKSALKGKNTVQNPFQDIKKLSSQKESKKDFNSEQRRKLKEYIEVNDGRLWLFILFMHYCFLRPKEIRALKISDIDLNEGRIKMRGEISKNKKNQFVRIPNQLLEILLKVQLNQYPSHFYLFGKKGFTNLKKCGENFFYDRNDKVLKLFGFSDDYSLYSWRHTAAIMFYKATKDLKGLQSQMRHHSLEVTNEYLKNMGVMDNENLKSNFPEL